MTESRTYTLETPGCTLTYDVRRNDSSTEPPLLMVGSPMTADAFGALASHFADRTVVTYDPRGAGRSPRTDGATQTTPEEHADDLHRLIRAVSDGPVDLFATSGGAVNALALVPRHPEDVRILVAHEPPVLQILPDREQVVAAAEDIHETYLRSGRGPAMARFIALVMQEGPIPADYLDRPAPDPAAFGLPVEDDGSRDDPLTGLNMVPLSHFQPDFDALRSARTRIVVGVSAVSGASVAGRAATVVADRLAQAPVVFPGGHAGFFPQDQSARPDEFGATLRDVLTSQ